MSSNDSDYRIRLFEFGDEEAIVELLKISFPEWRDAESPVDYWKWKYLENPIGSIIVVADLDSKIVGVEHRILLNVKVDEKTSASFGDDAAVHLDHRRKGIYRNILHNFEKVLNEKNIALRFGVLAHEAAIKMAEHEGFIRFPFSVSHMLQVRDVGMHFKMRPTNNNLTAIFGFSVLKLLNRLNNIVRQSSAYPEITIEDISLFDDRINLFWENTRDKYNFIIERNRDYLNWRYCDPNSNNKGKYFVKQAVEDSEILGFIILETRSKDVYSEGYIVDLLALPGRMDVARKLIAEALLFFKESDVNAVHYLVVKNHNYQEIFSEQGFIEVPSKMYITYKISQNKEKKQLIKDSNPSQVHFNYGDYY